jgi:DNA-binding response OmpR family regulator
MSHRILICEDDSLMAATLQRTLREQGYRVTVCRDGQSTLEQLAEEDFALLVLDLNLPDMDGFDVCRQMRHTSHIPVLMLTGRGDLVDRIVGLEVGADEYLVKPVGAPQLVAHVEALLRRCGDYALREPAEPAWELGDLHLDRERHEVLLGGRPVHLTPKEYELLCVLAENRGTVVRSAHLLMRVWGYDAEIRTRTLDVHIARLRAKLEVDAARPRYVITVSGVGYKLCVPEGLARAA